MALTTAVYAGLNLWPVAVTGALVRSQLLEDGTYPGAAAVFEAAEAEPPTAMDARTATADFDPDQPRDPQGRWANGGGMARPIVRAAHITRNREQVSLRIETRKILGKRRNVYVRCFRGWLRTTGRVR